MEGILRLLSSQGALLFFVLLFIAAAAVMLRFCTRRTVRIYSAVCLCLYGFFLVYITLLSRTPIIETRINLIPFQYDGMTLWEYFANIAMLIPFPILLYGIKPGKSNGFILIGAGIGLSLMIEIVQYFTHQGICDIDDLILNSIGVIVGALIAALFSKAFKRK